MKAFFVISHAAVGGLLAGAELLMPTPNWWHVGLGVVLIASSYTHLRDIQNDRP